MRDVDRRGHTKDNNVSALKEVKYKNTLYGINYG